jgi:uncharacterized membrane protein
MKFTLFHALPFIALVVASCSLLLAQEAEKNAVVTVEVTDQSGNPVPNAKTKFVALESADARALATDATGRALLELKPGNYDLVVTMPAFRTLKSRIKVSAGESEKFAIVLLIGSCPPGCVQVSTAASQLGTVQSQSETKDIHITNVKLFTWLGRR